MTLTNLALATVADVLEELYLKDNTIPDQIFRDNPWLGMIPKSTKGGGQYRHVQVKHARPQGRSATFSSASSNGVGSKRVGFDVTWVSNYQIAGIDGDVLDDSEGNETILIDHIKAETDGALDNMRDDIAMSLFRNRGGARATISSSATVASATLILANPEDIVNFEVGMVIVASSADGTSGSQRTGSATISALDRDAGTITTAGGNWSTQITSLATGDYLFVDGDRGLKMSGADAWIPSSAPGATTFFGVDRSVDPTRLGGVRYTGTGMPIEEALIQGFTRVQRLKKGQSVDVAFINPLKYAALEVSLEGRKRVVEMKGEGPAAHIGYKGLIVTSPSGDVPVFSDPSCQPNVAWGFKKSSWMLETVGDLVRLLNRDGLPFLRQASADGYELRIKSRGNVYCNEPGANVRIAL